MLVFESFSRPSRRSVIEPPTSVIPCAWAQDAIAATDSPSSSVSAAACSSSEAPIAFHFSGRIGMSAPVAAAWAANRPVFSRFAALSARLVSWTQATRSVPDMGWQDSSAHENASANPPGDEDDRPCWRLAESGPTQPRRHALPAGSGLPRDSGSARRRRGAGSAVGLLPGRDRGADRPGRRLSPRRGGAGARARGGRGRREGFLAAARPPFSGSATHCNRRRLGLRGGPLHGGPTPRDGEDESGGPALTG